MHKKTRKPIAVLAVLLAYIVPGAGHVYIGRWVRGLVIFLTIGATFWAGVALGGVLTVDKRTERWWYMAEMLTGVHGLVEARRSEKFYNDLLSRIPPSRLPRGMDSPSYYQSVVDANLGDYALVQPMDTIARAYAGVAGLLNLMCIFDAGILALMGSAAREGRQEEQKT